MNSLALSTSPRRYGIAAGCAALLSFVQRCSKVECVRKQPRQRSVWVRKWQVRRHALGASDNLKELESTEADAKNLKSCDERKQDSTLSSEGQILRS